MTSGQLFTLGAPLAIASVLVLVVLGSRLSAGRKERVERVLGMVFIPMVVLGWCVAAALQFRDGELLRAFMAAVMAIVMVNWLARILKTRAARTA